jgi:hypothetical protein
VFVVDSSDHFFVMVGQLIDNARIGGIPLIFDMRGGEVVEGVPSEAAFSASPEQELDDTGYARRVQLAGIAVDLADVRRVTVIYPDVD